MEQTIGKRIMLHRKQLKLTQDQLAEMLGVTAQAVSKWENDQSCPDISTLPKLAEIFDVTTDELLGAKRKETVYEAEVVEDSPIDEDDGLRVKNGNFEFRYEIGRKGTMCLALFVCAVGLQLFIAKLFHVDISFWSILWTTALITLGLYGIIRKFSFIKLGCALLGAYFLLDYWKLLPFHLAGELLFPALVVLLGLSLLVDAFKRPKRPTFRVKNRDKSNKMNKEYRVGADNFQYNASFGENSQLINMALLAYGEISTSFGEYTIDLSGVENVSQTCKIDANVSFGELTLLIPKRFCVIPDKSSAFGNVEISGQSDEVTEGSIKVEANASFGEINIQYI